MEVLQIPKVCHGAAAAVERQAVHLERSDVRRPRTQPREHGARAGLDLIPTAIATRDTNLLHRILIELRSFDNLLAFRFG